MKKIMKNKKGSVLVFALIILSFILVSAFSLSSVALMERRSSNASVNSSTAFQASDKGMEEFLQQIYKELDQNNTLIDVGESLNDAYGYNTVNGEYACIDGNRGGVSDQAARLGSKNTNFIITAYQEITGGAWTTIPEIKDCNTMLADVSRFRATGNYNSTARAVFLKLRDSLTRGLVAHWSFEDRAHIARVSSDPADRISFLAQDYSKQSHTLTLCDIDQDIDDPLSITIVGSTGDVTMDIQEFNNCEFVATGSGMNPKQKYNDTGDDDYDASGSWDAGIVEELAVASSIHGDDSNTEALYFNGSTTYLAVNFNNSCNQNDVNCIDKNTEDKLKFDDGIGISMWIKPDNADGPLVSRMNDSDEGYEFYLNSSDKICLKLNDKEKCSSSDINTSGNTWTHVVGRWRKSDDKIEIFVNGKLDSSGSAVAVGSDISTNMPDTFFVGASDIDGDLTMDNYYEGVIDDVRIWNRSLTQNEICRICNTAEIVSSNTNCDTAICP